ncbi:hypothetical protein KY285_026616, partial [Solanum tuberosum]
HQGEKDVIGEISSDQYLNGGATPKLGYDNPYRQMIFDAPGPNFPQGSSWQSFSNIEPESSHPCEPSMEEDPNTESQKLYDFLQAADAKLYPGSSLSQLAIVSRMYLGTLKRMIGNKASVEGSICEAYLMTESTQLFSHYFEPHVMTRNHNVDRNDDGGDKEDIEGNLSIFSHPGRLWGEAKKRDLSLEEIKVAQTYILLNCEEVEPFVSMFMQRLQEEFPNLSRGQIDESLEANFSIWFKEFVQCNPIENEFLRSLARGPLIDATCYSAYFVNGYKFHTECHGSTRLTMNSGVCISDPNLVIIMDG